MSSHPVSRVQSATPDDIFERVATRVEELLAELYVYQRSYTPPPNQLANKRINVTIKALETALQSAREQPEPVTQLNTPAASQGNNGGGSSLSQFTSPEASQAVPVPVPQDAHVQPQESEGDAYQSEADGWDD